jgi:hypothetical protein
MTEFSGRRFCQQEGRLTFWDITGMRLRSISIIVLVALIGLGPFARMAFAAGEMAPAIAEQDSRDQSFHKSCINSSSDLACVGICHTAAGTLRDDASLIAPVAQYPAPSRAETLSCSRIARANAIRAPPLLST